MIGKLTFALLSLHASATAAITWEQILGRERKDCEGALQSRETFAFRDIRWGEPAASLGVSHGAPADGRFDVVVGDRVVVEVADRRVQETPLVSIWWMGKLDTRTLFDFAQRVIPAGTPPELYLIKAFDTADGADDGPKVSALMDSPPRLGSIYATFWGFEAREWRRKLARQPMSLGLSYAAQASPLEGFSLRAPTGRGAHGKVQLNVRPDLLQHPDFRAALHDLIDATSSDYLLWPRIAEALNKVADELKP